MSKICFENAHCHTYLSNALTGFPDSPTALEDYAKVYSERGMQCLIASEHGYRGDVWLQADTASKYENMKAICGAEVYFVPNRNPELKDNRNFHLLLLAKNNEGFKELNMTLSQAQMTGFYHHGRLDFELLSSLNYKNFLCTTACVGGILKDESYEELACQLAEIFRENFRLEVQYHLNEKQIEHNSKVLKLYKKYNWPLFFATDSHYINKEDKILRKELQLSRKISMDDSEWDLYLPTADEAFESMIKQNVLSKSQIEEAFDNTLELRDWDGFSYTTERKLPISKLRKDMTVEERKRLYQKMVCQGYIQKAGMPDEEQKKELRDEMNVILDTDSEDYFISLKDMLDRGVELGGILTTTARGSAGSFASNYALGFTTINRLDCPITFYPERFISADKLKAGNPDIDSNLTNVEAFEQAGKEMFGEYGCLPIIAYGKTKTSSAFKLLARAKNIDFELSNNISKQIQNYELDKKHASENNTDDPDYNVDDDVQLTSYIEEQYMQLVEDSVKYQGIIMTLSPHPCAHITYHKDMREEIGVIKLKDKYCLFIDGVTADKLNYVKSDMLRVDVVKMISDGFGAADLPVMPVSELLKVIEGDKNIWDLYANGFTQCLNQCEKPASTQKCMQFKPKNISELAYFIAAIRPGFKSNIQTFITRQKFNYGIPALDNLLKLENATGMTGESSYLIYDENILRCLKFAGIPGPEAYATIKHIKKKHKPQVLAMKDKFKQGFVKYLIENEHATEETANETTEMAWKVIEDSASYLFCGSHAFAMACDSAYCAYLKAYFPYEFYTTILKLYTEKNNLEKIALIIEEMKRYKDIKLTAGLFGQDNRDWHVDKENHTISQSISSIKYISKKAAEDLYEAGQHKFDTFVDLLRYLQMNTVLDTRQVETLIGVNYFKNFGGNKKLLTIMNEFYTGKNKLTKTVKSYEKRLEAMREFESELKDENISITQQLKNENSNIGLCLTCCPNLTNNIFYVQNIDQKYGIKIKLYNAKTGGSGIVKMKKDTFARKPLEENTCIIITEKQIKPRYVYMNGKSVPSKTEKDYWILNYKMVE